MENSWLKDSRRVEQLRHYKNNYVWLENPTILSKSKLKLIIKAGLTSYLNFIILVSNSKYKHWFYMCKKCVTLFILCKTLIGL